jgi:hypothetical protein
MVFVLRPSPIDPVEQHWHSLWVREECYRFYVEHRRHYCSHLQLLDLWLQAPYCEDCIWSDPFKRDGRPDIAGKGWQVDIVLKLGGGFSLVDEIEEILKEDSDFSF